MSGGFCTNLKQASKKTGKYLQDVAWQTCKCILWSVCVPCVCCAIVLLPTRRHVPESLAQQKPQMPMPRRRPLSIPSSHFQLHQRLVEQPNSLFMTKLPLEIRRCVYEYALGGKSVHARISEGRLYARRCPTLGACRCRQQRLRQEKNLDFALALLRTCRLIYSEAIEYLYTCNSFSLSTASEQIPTINYLSYFTLPHRITMIRDLRMYWEIDSHHHNVFRTVFNDSKVTQWLITWTSIARLTGLQHLHVRLVFSSLQLAFFLDSDQVWEANGPALLGAIPKIPAKDFVIVLPSNRNSTKVPMQNPHCILRLPSQEDSDQVSSL